MSEPKKHHYVPQWILRGFSFDKKEEKIYIADKVEGDIRPGAILDRGMQNYFYKYKESGESLELSFVRGIDDAGSLAYSNAQKTSVDHLGAHDKYSLRRFFAAQMLRVPAMVGSLQRFDEDLRSELGEEFTVVKKSPHSDFLDSLVKNIDGVERELRSRRMRILVKKSSEHRFLIGDSPVYRVNYGETANALQGHGLPVVVSDFMAMPLSPFAILVFYKDEAGLDLSDLIDQNNGWQFINAERFVFSNTQEHLEQELKEHYKVSYNYVEALRPGLLKQQGVKYGDRVDVGPMRIAFSDDVKKELREKFIAQGHKN